MLRIRNKITFYWLLIEINIVNSWIIMILSPRHRRVAWVSMGIIIMPRFHTSWNSVHVYIHHFWVHVHVNIHGHVWLILLRISSVSSRVAIKSRSKIVVILVLILGSWVSIFIIKVCGLSRNLAFFGIRKYIIKSYMPSCAMFSSCPRKTIKMILII